MALSIATAVGSIGLFAADLLGWLIAGTMRPVTIGRLIGIESIWLHVPLWIFGPVVSVVMLVLFYETWSFAVRKDMAVDAARGRAECGGEVEDGMI